MKRFSIDVMILCTFSIYLGVKATSNDEIKGLADDLALAKKSDTVNAANYSKKKRIMESLQQDSQRNGEVFKRMKFGTADDNIDMIEFSFKRPEDIDLIVLKSKLVQDRDNERNDLASIKTKSTECIEGYHLASGGIGAECKKYLEAKSFYKKSKHLHRKIGGNRYNEKGQRVRCCKTEEISSSSSESDKNRTCRNVALESSDKEKESKTTFEDTCNKSQNFIRRESDEPDLTGIEKTDGHFKHSQVDTVLDDCASHVDLEFNVPGAYVPMLWSDLANHQKHILDILKLSENPLKPKKMTKETKSNIKRHIDNFLIRCPNESVRKMFGDVKIMDYDEALAKSNITKKDKFTNFKLVTKSFEDKFDGKGPIILAKTSDGDTISLVEVLNNLNAKNFKDIEKLIETRTKPSSLFKTIFKDLKATKSKKSKKELINLYSDALGIFILDYECLFSFDIECSVSFLTCSKYLDELKDVCENGLITPIRFLSVAYTEFFVCGSFEYRAKLGLSRFLFISGMFPADRYYSPMITFLVDNGF